MRPFILILAFAISGCGQSARTDELRDIEISDLHRQMMDMNSRVAILERNREHDVKRFDKILEQETR